MSDRWYVLNAREAKWYDRGPRGSVARLVEGTERCRELPQMAQLQEAADEIVRRAQKTRALRRDLTAEEIFELVPAASRFPDVILDGLHT